MSTLTYMTLQTLDNYRDAANQAVVVYRLGSRRLVNVVNATLEHSVYPRTARLAPKTTRRMDGVRGNVSDVMVKGIDQVAERTEQAIEMGRAAAVEQIKKAARFAENIDNDLVAMGLQGAARLTLPGAKVALAVSNKVAQGANALAGVAGARPERKADRKTVSKTARKTVRKTVGKAAAKTTGKTAGNTAVKTLRQTAVKSVRKAASKVEREVAPTVRRADDAVEAAVKRVARVARVAKDKTAPVKAAVRRAPRAVRKVAAQVAAA